MKTRKQGIGLKRFVKHINTYNYAFAPLVKGPMHQDTNFLGELFKRI